MAALQCEICGGKLMAKSGGIFECDSCGMQYDKTRIQEMVQEIKGTVKVEGTVEVKGSVKIDQTSANDALLQQMFGLLRNHEFHQASIMADTVLSADPNNSDALIGKLLASKHYVSKDEMMRCSSNIDRTREYKTILASGNNEAIAFVEKCLEAEELRIRKGTALKEKENGELQYRRQDYSAALEHFQNAAAYYNVADWIEKCQQRLNAGQNFSPMIAAACSNDSAQIRNALSFFEANSFSGKCALAAEACKEKLAMLDSPENAQIIVLLSKKDEVTALELELEAMKHELSGLGFFGNKDKKNALKNSIAQKESLRDIEKADIASMESQYSASLAARQEVEAILNSLQMIHSLASVKEGDTISFGKYYFRSKDDIQPMQWQVNKVTDQYVDVTCVHIQDFMLYRKERVDLKKGDRYALNAWFEDTFMPFAFNRAEQKFISSLRSGAGKVLTATPTPYAKAKGMRVDRSTGNGDFYHSYYVTKDSEMPHYYDNKGELHSNKYELSYQLSKLPEEPHGVRPRMTIYFDTL